MATAVSKPNPSTLDHVRLVEEEMARQIASAQLQAEEIIRQAEAQAKALLKEAHSNNQQIRQIKYQHILASSEAEAQALVEQAKLRAEDIRQSAAAHIETAVDYATAYVLGEPARKRKP